MDKDTKFALLVIGVPFLGLLYVALILGIMLFSPWSREHPIITATVFVIAPSLVSGSIWLFGSVKARNKENLGL
jgi:glucose uptake protein GlcU